MILQHRPIVSDGRTSRLVKEVNMTGRLVNKETENFFLGAIKSKIISMFITIKQREKSEQLVVVDTKRFQCSTQHHEEY